MQEHKIEVEKRELSTQKSVVRQLRNSGKIPGVYYSHDSKSSIAFCVDKKELHKALKSTAQVYKISVGGKNRDVIIKSMQYHPISEDVLHIDLYGVKMDTKVNVKVPIVFIGQCEGVKAGGVLNQNASELEIACLPSAIPQNIELDISNLNIGDTLRLSDITLDDTIELLGDSEALIASIILPAKQEEPEEAVSEDGEEGDAPSDAPTEEAPSTDSDTGDSE